MAVFNNMENLHKIIQVAKEQGIPKEVMKTGMRIIEMLIESGLSMKEIILVLDILLGAFKGLEERRR